MNNYTTYILKYVCCSVVSAAIYGVFSLAHIHFGYNMYGFLFVYALTESFYLRLRILDLEEKKK